MPEEQFTVVGLNHQTAAVDLRETLACRPDEGKRLASILKEEAGLSNAAVLSTCSRFEVYSSVDDPGLDRLLKWLKRRAGREIDDSFYIRNGPEAIKHLFRVAAGLDSWIIGETEILGQVKAAYQDASSSKAIGRAGHLAFQRALYVGKKVRNETAVIGGIASIGGAAAVLAKRIFQSLSETKILVFGAGAMAASTVRHLGSKGVGETWVANRNIERAAALSCELGGVPMTLEQGFDRLVDADIAVFSTSSASCLLNAEQARRIAARRGGRSLFIIDLCVPRNVDPEAARIEGLYLYDIDNLRQIVQENLDRRKANLIAAEEIVRVEALDCWDRITFPGARTAVPA